MSLARRPFRRSECACRFRRRRGVSPEIRPLGSPPIHEVNEATEQRVETRRMLAIAEMASLIENMNFGLSLVRADHLEQIEGTFRRDCRIVATKHDLRWALQAAFAQPL